LHEALPICTLRCELEVLIAGIDIGKIKPAAKQGFHKALLMCERPRFVHIPLNARVTLKIAVDILLRLGATQMQLLGQPECRHALNQAEVGGLGAETQLWVYLVKVDSV